MKFRMFLYYLFLFFIIAILVYADGGSFNSFDRVKDLINGKLEFDLIQMRG